jgi:hypothetical protein
LIFSLCLGAFSLFAGDVSGKWSGQWETSPDGAPGPHYMVLKQEGQAVNGTAGPAADRQIGIQNGKLAEDTLKFDIAIPGGGPTLRFEFKVAGDAMSGQAILDMDGKQQKFKLAAKRVKE